MNLEKRVKICSEATKTPFVKQIYFVSGYLNYCMIEEKLCKFQGELKVIYRSPAQETKRYECLKHKNNKDVGGFYV